MEFDYVHVIYSKFTEVSEFILIFISIILMFGANGKYSYGRKMRRDTISEIMLRLFVNSNGKLDWKFMEDYIKSLSYGDRLNN